MSNKIYAKARFAFNNKPLSWWEEKNPVLENGEPALVSDSDGNEWLKIGDGKTAWNDLPWKKAIRVDKTYSPESPNAQSGLAVAEAVNKKMDKFGEVTAGEATVNITLETQREISFSAATPSLGAETCYDFVLIAGGGTIPEDYISPEMCVYMEEQGGWGIGWSGGSMVAVLPDSFIPLTTADLVKVDLENNILYAKYQEKTVAIKNVATPQDGRDAANRNYVDQNVGDINGVLAAIIAGSSALPDAIINKLVSKAAKGVETKIGNRFVTAVAVRDTGSITVEPNAAYCIISNSESGKAVVYDRLTDEPVEFTGKIIGMITGNYGDSNPSSVLGLLGIYSSAVITKGTYLAIDSSKSATFSWEGEATVITVKNIKGE